MSFVRLLRSFCFVCVVILIFGLFSILSVKCGQCTQLMNTVNILSMLNGNGNTDGLPGMSFPPHEQSGNKQTSLRQRAAVLSGVGCGYSGPGRDGGKR